MIITNGAGNNGWEGNGVLFWMHFDSRVQLHVTGDGNVLVAGEDVLDAALQIGPDLLQVDLFKAGRATVPVGTAADTATTSLHPVDRCCYSAL